ncbi:hypothetical protein D3C87_1386900 [compost metagenome]
MPRGFIAATAGALASAGLGGAALAQTAAPHPPIFDLPASPPLLVARDATLRCDGRRIDAVYAESLSPRVIAAPSTADHEPSTLVLQFSINEEGRPRSIRPAPAAAPRFIPTDDAQATLAAFRFAPGQARADCAMTVRQTPRPLAEASREHLAFAYAVDRARPAAVARQLARQGDDCGDRPRPAVAVYPSPDVGRPGLERHSLERGARRPHLGRGDPRLVRRRRIRRRGAPRRGRQHLPARRPAPGLHQRLDASGRAPARRA